MLPGAVSPGLVLHYAERLEFGAPTACSHELYGSRRAWEAGAPVN
jgi:hypothetical protein